MVSHISVQGDFVIKIVSSRRFAYLTFSEGSNHCLPSEQKTTFLSSKIDRILITLQVKSQLALFAAHCEEFEFLKLRFLGCDTSAMGLGTKGSPHEMKLTLLMSCE